MDSGCSRIGRCNLRSNSFLIIVLTPSERKALGVGEKIIDYFGKDWTVDELLKDGRIRAHFVDKIGWAEMVIDPEDMERRFTVKEFG